MINKGRKVPREECFKSTVICSLFNIDMLDELKLLSDIKVNKEFGCPKRAQTLIQQLAAWSSYNIQLHHLARPEFIK